MNLTQTAGWIFEWLTRGSVNGTQKVCCVSGIRMFGERFKGGSCPTTTTMKMT